MEEEMLSFRSMDRSDGYGLQNIPEVLREKFGQLSERTIPQCVDASLKAETSRRQSAVRAVARALVISGGVSLLGLLLRGIMQRLTDDDSARCPSGGHERITIGELVAEVSAACAEGHVANGTWRRNRQTDRRRG